MAGIKISELPATSVILAEDQFPLSRGDSTRRISGSQLMTRDQYNELSSEIDTLSATTFQELSSLGQTVENKKRWADFTSN